LRCLGTFYHISGTDLVFAMPYSLLLYIKTQIRLEFEEGMQRYMFDYSSWICISCNNDEKYDEKYEIKKRK